MIRIVIILFFSNICFSQSLYKKDEVNRKPTEYYTAKYVVTFKRTLYGVSFDKNTPKELKNRLEQYLKTNQRTFIGFGTFQTTIILQNSKYYILQKDKFQNIEI